MKSEQLLAKSKNCTCSSKKTNLKKRNLPILFTIIIAILPKCPFCIIAYSSAITMCSGQKIYDHSPTAASAISILLALVVIGSILLNYRDIRTVFAFIFALVGGALVTYAELYTGEMLLYNTGASLLLFAAFLNGSLIHFARKLFKYLNQVMLNDSVSKEI